MSILNFKRKEKKITVKFFLRKEQGEVKIPYIHQPDIVYYPLYIDCIHRRKKNRCKSLFLQFHIHGTNVQNVPYIYFNEFGVATREFNNEIESLINGSSPLVRSYQFDLLDLLICEKQHAFNLFKLFEGISDDDFHLSNLSEGYHYSLGKRAYEIYDEALKELLLEEFQKFVPTYPIKLLKIALASYTYHDFFSVLINIFNMTAPYARTEVYSKKLMVLGLSLAQIDKMIYKYVTAKPHTRLTLTIPTWVIENHSNKLNSFLKGEVFFRDSFNNKASFDIMVDTILGKAEEKLKVEISNIRSYFGGTSKCI